MATKVTLSSSPVQHSKLTGDVMDLELSTEPQYHQPEDASPPNYTMKRPPTPPKSKQPTLTSWKQHRVVNHNASNDYDRRSPEPFQSTNMNKSFSSNSSNSNSNNNSKHTKSQQHLYHAQPTTETNKDHLQQPPPLLQKKSPGHLDEFFILQEQMDLTHRHRDQLMEENGILKYHLHVLQYRLQAMESMWYGYYDRRKKRASWIPSHSQHLPPQQRHWHQPWLQSDYLAESFPPLVPPYFMTPSLSNHLDTTNRSLPEHHKDSDDSRHQRFRRQRSKSLPRDTSFSSIPSDRNSNMGNPLHHQPLMFPPQPPILRPIPPFPSRPQPFGRSSRVPPRFQQTKKYAHPSINSNNNNSDSNTDDSDSGSKGNSMDDLDDDDDLRGRGGMHSRHPRHHRYRTDYTADKSPMRSSSYPLYRHQASNTDLPMDPLHFVTDPSFDDPYDFHSANGGGDDNDDDGWKYTSAPPRYYNNGNLHQHHRSDRFNEYPRQPFYGDSHQQQPSNTSSQWHPPQYRPRNE